MQTQNPHIHSSKTSALAHVAVCSDYKCIPRDHHWFLTVCKTAILFCLHDHQWFITHSSYVLTLSLPCTHTQTPVPEFHCHQILSLKCYSYFLGCWNSPCPFLIPPWEVITAWVVSGHPWLKSFRGRFILSIMKGDSISMSTFCSQQCFYRSFLPLTLNPAVA